MFQKAIFTHTHTHTCTHTLSLTHSHTHTLTIFLFQVAIFKHTHTHTHTRTHTLSRTHTHTNFVFQEVSLGGGRGGKGSRVLTLRASCGLTVFFDLIFCVILFYPAFQDAILGGGRGGKGSRVLKCGHRYDIQSSWLVFLKSWWLVYLICGMIHSYMIFECSNAGIGTVWGGYM